QGVSARSSHQGSGAPLGADRGRQGAPGDRPTLSVRRNPRSNRLRRTRPRPGEGGRGGGVRDVRSRSSSAGFSRFVAGESDSNESPTKSRPLQRSRETDETRETETCSLGALVRLAETHETFAAKLPRCDEISQQLAAFSEHTDVKIRDENEDSPAGVST